MTCPMCGAENLEDSLFCNKCGTKLNSNTNFIRKDKVKLKEKIRIIASFRNNAILKNKRNRIILLLIILGFTILCSVYFYNKDTRKFIHLFNNKKYSDAQTYYNEVIDKFGDNKKNRIDKSLKDYFRKQSNKIKEDFLNDEKNLEYSVQIATLERMLYYDIDNEEIKSAQYFLTKLRDSRHAFNEAEKAFSNKDYYNSILQYKNVIEDDKSFSNAEKRINEILPLLKKERFDLAEKHYKAKEIDSAIDALSSITKFYDNDKALNEKLNFYKAEKVKEDKIIAEKKENRKNELLTYMSKYVDSVSNNVMYVHKPYGEALEIHANEVIFQPYLRGELGSTVFKLIAGFNRSNWLFMRKIICNADGYIFELNFDYFNRNTEIVVGGGVDEWVEIPCFDRKDIDIGINKNPKMLEDLIKLGKSRNALIKFEGDTQAMDYTLTEEQKNILLNVIELHNISKKY